MCLTLVVLWYKCLLRKSFWWVKSTWVGVGDTKKEGDCSAKVGDKRQVSRFFSTIQGRLTPIIAQYKPNWCLFSPLKKFSWWLFQEDLVWSYFMHQPKDLSCKGQFIATSWQHLRKEEHSTHIILTHPGRQRKCPFIVGEYEWPTQITYTKAFWDKVWG